MKNIKKLLSGFLVLSLILSFLISCNNTKDVIVSDETDTTTVEETTYPELEIIITSDGERIYESMDYVFIPDDRVIDKWNVVDYVQYIDDFDPSIQSANFEFYWQSVEFFEDGFAELKYKDSSFDIHKWTKGYILVEMNQVIESYTIKEIGGTNYLFVDWKSGDYIIRGQKPKYYVFKKDPNHTQTKNVKYTLEPYNDVRSLSYKVGDLSRYDLSEFGENMLTLTFNEKTIFPSSDKMPSKEKLQPKNILEAGKNPGLDVRAIHEEGITGKGVTVAIIDQPLYVDSHSEYKGKIIEYKDFDCGTESSMHGPAVTSLLVGDTIGTAPGAKVYYAAAPSWKGDATYFAYALDWIVETNENLPDDEKIRVVSVSAAPSDNSIFKNSEKWVESVNKANEAGILVLDCTSEFSLIGGCTYDYYDRKDVTKCTTNWNNTRAIFAPTDYRTTAEEYEKGDCSYQYDGRGGLSWGIPYVAGVLAMGWEVKPELTSDEIVQILLDTAYVDDNGYKYINPTEFINYLKNN